MEGGDALSVILIEQYLHNILPPDMNRALSTLVKRARLVLDEKQEHQQWLNKVAIIEPLISPNYKLIADDIKSPLMHALFNNIFCKISYKKPDGIQKIYTVKPLGLIMRSSRFNLVCEFEHSKRVGMLVVNRIKNINYNKEDTFNPPGDFNLAEYIATGAPHYLLSEDQIRVTLEVTEHASALLQEGTIGNDFKLSLLENNWNEVKFTTAFTHDLVAWILCHIRDIKIVAPKELRELVLEELQSGLNNHNKHC